MSNPLISVVMPNLNGAKRLRSAIQSVLSQSYINIELIVVDARSSDSSHEILMQLCAEDVRIRWIQEGDCGLSNAINIGIRAAKGDIVGYLGNDDEFLPGLFEHIGWMADRVDFDALMFSSYTYFVEERRCLLRRPAVQEVTPESLLAHGTIVGLQNTFYRARVFKQHSYDESNKYSMDYQLLWDLLADECKRMFVFSDIVASVNYFEGNLSHNNLAQNEEAMSIAQRHAAAYDGPVWFHFMLPPPLPQQPTPRWRRIVERWIYVIRWCLGSIK